MKMQDFSHFLEPKDAYDHVSSPDIKREGYQAYSRQATGEGYLPFTTMSPNQDEHLGHTELAAANSHMAGGYRLEHGLGCCGG